MMPVFHARFLTSLAVSAMMMAVVPVAAQTQNSGSPPSAQSLEGKGDCNSANKAEAATAPDRRSADGTAPGNIGSTGWTGGTGGAHMGTNPQGALPESRTWQPPTARGLDLAMAVPSEQPAVGAAEARQGC
ncbi:MULTISPECIES: hypothetical protein [Rhizobium/Agrobacterium group]|jgi:hypothetical protein|uniref:hypothetical protein n=1 Tax=Rhizobium/Agrobacterium group TaxID=227290 RepID=UPI00184F689F|nr:hypothetical protein [Agrobacterium sp. Ap1]